MNMSSDAEKAMSIVEMWFHSFDGEHKLVKSQGQVLGYIGDYDYVIVKLYEWITGGPSCIRIVPFPEVVNWDFYESNEEMKNVFETIYAHRLMNEYEKMERQFKKENEKHD